jgi:hypothetical protein
MTGKLGAILDQRSREGFAGREAELAVLGSLLDPGGPRVVHLSGVTGIGKSALLGQFAARARDAGATIVRVDCRAVEPSVPGLLGALAEATGASAPAIEPIAARLAAFRGPVVLAFDGYELFWLVDTFIRRELCPQLPDSSRLVLAGRTGPVGAWLSAPEWQGLFRALTLGPLTEHEAIGYLQRLGADRDAARRINAVAHGHPLALAVAARLGTGPAAGRPEDAAMGAVMELVAHDYLATATDPLTREALEAASVLRRVTGSLLRAMLPGIAPADVMDRLRSLPFVDAAADGLFIHDAVRDGVSTSLMASDPERHRGYRVAAWHQLRGEVAHATRATLWRYTADILYLLQNYLVREGFFPSGCQPMAVEPALPSDADAVHTITARHEGPEAAEVVDSWWALHRAAFRVCRDAVGKTTGIFVVMKGSDLSEDIIAADPVAAAWAQDMQAGGHAAQSLMLRRLLDHREGEANSGSRGAFGVEVKRTYMEMRPGLRYVYLCGIDSSHFDWCDALGFEQLPALSRTLDRRAYRTFRLDMGPGSVDAWLARIVADELGIPREDRCNAPFDPEAQELVVAGVSVALTPLELGVMRVLHARPGRPVSRADLFEQVWGYGTAATSNVVDAVILTLRRKLGTHAATIETVRGVGYRYRP